ncbi:laminin subunit alpha-1-like [Physella acuta]|uniref:laminin subunit alpha-1-like n=1 Tax=Physella acuta TaxID=109671 RepID=UPI0027DB0C40|nr:laminin subunit alpha-1-like [Physella acuta]
MWPLDAARLTYPWILVVCVYLGFVHPQRAQDDLNGLFPVVFNLATRAKITSNATCGESRSEVFCKLVEHVRIFPAENRHCDICDARSDNPAQRHPITHAIDGSNRWWQSPTLTNGPEFNHVTITLDLGQIYQVAYIIVKAANAPRPGNWILERSLDGVTYKPWQYFAMTDNECREAYRKHPTVGVPDYLADDEVICTSRYSALTPLENGEIFVSLVNGRPGVFQPSKILLDFTSARFVQLRFQKIRTLNADLMTFSTSDPKSADDTVTRRYFYSVKDISIGGQCICYGHATYCRRHETVKDRLQCQCLHNTGGDNCEKCLPMFNNKPWQVGGIQNIGCEECNCHGKADQCQYNATVDALGLGMNIMGERDGGGVCINCKEYTTGINCERCIEGYYRPRGMTPDMRNPCRRCNCRETTTTQASCVPDDSRMDEGLKPGDCICKEGYSGSSCSECALGYYGYPNCRPCRCNIAGIVDARDCEGVCVCKENVDGSRCDRCKPEYFNLDQNNAKGCIHCFCFGVTNQCDSVDWGLTTVNEVDGWVLSTLDANGLTILPNYNDDWLEAKISYQKSQEEIHYWVAPSAYLGNRISSYGGMLKFSLMFNLDRKLRRGEFLEDPTFILQGYNKTICSEKTLVLEDVEHKMSIRLHEDNWRHLHNNRPVSREEFMTVLYDLQRLLIRATFHTTQDTVYLKDVILDVASPTVMDGSSLKSVEQCQCPEGYAGLSCESCKPGWRRVNDRLIGGTCRKCECHNHASDCDSVTGFCKNCRHNTKGRYCEECLPGFYGNPLAGTPDDCRPCACPLISGNNFFAERCVARPTAEDMTAYVCINCRTGYTGDRCHMCSPGYFGDPTTPGGSCRRCSCGPVTELTHPNICNNMTGTCNFCSNNAEGPYCDRCKPGFYGTALNGDCKPCECYERGSNNLQCNIRTGQCSCRSRFTGLKCDKCQLGYGNIERGCERCNCDRRGSQTLDCDQVTGQCECKSGIEGLSCNQCQKGFYDFTVTGCKRCNCYAVGTNDSVDCDPYSGRCICKPGVEGSKCDKCQDGHFGLTSGQGCSPCMCSAAGSRDAQCAQESGQCECKAGVGGLKCDRCLPGYFGFSASGCKVCEPCTAKGHICDPVTGKCVCPPNTEGPNCEICITNGWGFDEEGGCKLCQCSPTGSRSQQCDKKTGKCSCQEGYAGLKCDSCSVGYHGYPDCRACGCLQAGVIDDTCEDSVCECDGTGQCLCKENVEGPRCDVCRAGTFGLSKENPKGCTECYCFLRGESCKQAPYVYTEIELPTMSATFSSAGHPLVRKFGYLIINSSHTAVPDDLAEQSLYWLLPDTVSKDMVLSYNGKLSFYHYFSGSMLSAHLLEETPLVVLIGNGFELHATPSILEPKHAMKVDVTLNEEFWNLPGMETPVSRRVLMVVLQNVTAILVKAAQNGHTTNAEIDSVTIQKAVPQKPGDRSTDLAWGVELCECSDRYSGESCQKPGAGFYVPAHPVPDINVTKPETAIGEIKRCRCHQHSNTCDPETGRCYNCQHNTTGHMCEICADGFFGTATSGTPSDCQPCTCPLSVPSNNFSPTCIGGRNGVMCTACQEGYSGQRCQSCTSGYYGNPQQIGDTCKLCHCNPDGSTGLVCDPVSGQCPCIGGISGRKCDACTDPTFGVQNGKCVSCYTGCTGILLDDLRKMTLPLVNINVSGAIYPWEKLTKLDNEVDRLREKLSLAEAAGIKELDSMKESADRYNLLADNLLTRSTYTTQTEVNTTGAEVHKVKDQSQQLRKNASDMEAVVMKTYADIQRLVDELQGLVERVLVNKTGINMTSALNSARKILNEIQGRNFTPASDATQRENRLAEELSNRIKEIQKNTTNDVSIIEYVLSDLRKRLEDLLDQSKLAEDTSVLAMERIEILKRLLKDLKKLMDQIKKLEEESLSSLSKAQELLDKAETNLVTSTGQNNMLDTWLEMLAANVSKLASPLQKLNILVREVYAHVDNLKLLAKEIKDLFAKTKGHAENAVKASSAYKDIVDAIQQARKSALDALRDATESRDIADVDRLKREVNRLIAKSREQLDTSNSLLNNSTVLNNKLSDIQSELDDAVVKHQDNLADWNEVDRKLKQLPKDIKQNINAVAEETATANQTTTAALNIYNKLKDAVDAMKNRTSGGKPDLSDVDTELARALEAEKEIYELHKLKQDTDNRLNALSKNLSDVTVDLKNLTEKIRDARSRVNEMKLSLLADGQCYRTYRSPLTPSSTNEIKFAFKLSSPPTDNMLLLLLQQSPQDGGKEFLAAEIRDQKVRFTWNSGKGQKHVIHDQQLEVEKWYQVQAKRIGSIGQLKVWSMEDSTEQSTETKEANVGVGCSLMNLNDKALVALAGTDRLTQTPEGITQKNFVGCMGEVFVDYNRIGVYNFKTDVENHCSACTEVPLLRIRSSKLYVFEGRGFAQFPVKYYSSKKTKIEMHFKTFWENSRIFFIGNEAQGDFLSMELKDGQVAVHFDMGGSSVGFARTNKTYNNNQWTTIIFQRNLNKAVLKVNDESISITSSGTSTGLDLNGATMFFGGIPRELVVDKFKGLNASDFFYGCMRDIIFDTSPPEEVGSVLNNVQTSSGCRENGIHSVDFRGDGYLLLRSEHIEFAAVTNDVSLTFVTKKEDGVILVARDIPSDVSPEKINNFYSLSIVGGQLEARFQNSNSQKVVLKSTDKFNDGEMHCVSLIKSSNQEVELVVDDVAVDKKTAVSIGFNNSGDLYLGGSPTDILSMGVVPTDAKLDGCVSDVIANGVLLSMADASQYKRADVGRCRFTGVPNTPTLLPVADEPVTCAKDTVPIIEDDANSVANAASFFAEITKLDPRLLSNQFTFAYDFRTFYPNGLFGYLTNEDKDFYLGVQLREGKLEVAYIHQGQRKTLTFEEFINDGKWHSVNVVKSGTSITVGYDKVPEKIGPIDGVLNIALPLHLGGPAKKEEFTDNDIQLVSHSVRGCIRSLKVNNIPINITDTQVIQDVSSCFRNVEAGIYFPGDAWAIYATDYVIEANFVISLEFRTTSQEGLLVTVSEKNGRGLTLELNDGQLRLELKNNVNTFTAETSNRNVYKYCDKKWHTVTAKLLNGDLTLNVDGRPSAEAKVLGSSAIKTGNLLFIGGIMVGFEQATSKHNDYFTGCIKNLNINGQQVDWYALIGQQNLRKTACPIS